MSSATSQTGLNVLGRPISMNAPQKGVTIFDEPEHIEPRAQDEADSRSASFVAQSPREHHASISGKKLTGRPPLQQNVSVASLSQQLLNFELDEFDTPEDRTSGQTQARTLLTQVVEWLHDEKNKRASRRLHHQNRQTEGSKLHAERELPQNDEADQDLALDKLERILAGFAATTLTKHSRKQSTSMPRKGSIVKKLKRGSTIPPGATSDTDTVDAIAEVPHVEASLDNSKTMAFTGGEAEFDVSDAVGDTSDAARQKEQKNWDTFKQEIVRLTHTLKLRGWRRIPIEQGALISVERLSGALTNAVYVVKPPTEMPDTDKVEEDGSGKSKKMPLNLLLRIYGPQVEHLIDRENELTILRRLAAKRIGPRLLGYFSNGRFEEFLHAKTLKAEDLRIPDTSVQIAKRMRELHEGVELLESERDGGPFVFSNWNKWVDRCEKVITYLDLQVKREAEEWPVFRGAIEKYRKVLLEECGGDAGLRKQLVFAHNDTQYGNLMRLAPPNESPFLQPTNQHKQLVVIDFEYASANTPGLEFANHFTEWCYNYHHAEASFACNTDLYPSPKEQHRFVRAYVMHRPQFNPAASGTPKLEAREKTNISDFMLDARNPGAMGSIDYNADERVRDEAAEKEIQMLLHQTRLWRVANSAQWVAWGIVQAKVPELDEKTIRSRATAILEKAKQIIHPRSDPLDPEVKERQEEAKHDRPEGREAEEAHAEGDVEEEEEEEGDFDYLAYAQERAMFFWGDCIQMGIVKEADLPESMRAHVKYVKY